MVRPPDTGLMEPLRFIFESRALFLVTLSASTPERLRRVVVTISFRLGEAMAWNPGHCEDSFQLWTSSSRRLRFDPPFRSLGATPGDGEPVTDPEACLACA